jgi:hypothetical protein
MPSSGLHRDRAALLEKLLVKIFGAGTIAAPLRQVVRKSREKRRGGIENGHV